MKGPGYCGFLAVSSYSGFPLPVTQSIFNCIALGALCWVLYRLSGSRVLAFVIFVLVLWDPGLLCLRVLRQAIYPGQLLLLLAGLLYTLFCARTVRSAGLVGSLSGLLFGWFWLTREES